MTRSRWAGAAVTAIVLTLGVPATTLAQGRGRGQEQRAEHSRFDDHDREIARGWYVDHQRSLPPGLRDRDRLAPDREARFTIGFFLDRDDRGRIHSVPSDLVRRLPPAPRGDRYVFIGLHLCLINGRYEVLDVIHLGHER